MTSTIASSSMLSSSSGAFHHYLAKLSRRDRMLYILLKSYQKDAMSHPGDGALIASIYEPEIQLIIGEKQVDERRMKKYETIDRQMDEKFGKWDDSEEEIDLSNENSQPDLWEKKEGDEKKEETKGEGEEK